jgi:hypothetical protein
MIINKMIIAITVLGTVAHGIVRAESTTKIELKPAARFETQELRETPVIDKDHPDCKDNKYGFEGGALVKLDGLIDKGNDSFTLFYTAENNKRFWPVSMIKLKMIKETQ